MLLFVDGCSARMDSTQFTTAHHEGHRRSGDHIRGSDHSNSDIRETCHASRNKPSDGDGVVNIYLVVVDVMVVVVMTTGRDRETGEAYCGVCDFKSPVCSK